MMENKLYSRLLYVILIFVFVYVCFYECFLKIIILFLILFNRLPTDVDMAARFVLTTTPNAALIERAKTVYQTGLSKFPKSPTVLQAYVNFPP